MIFSLTYLSLDVYEVMFENVLVRIVEFYYLVQPKPHTVQRTKLCLSELSANDVMRRFNSPRPFLLPPPLPILRHCDAFVANFTAAEFHALYCTFMCYPVVLSGDGVFNRSKGVRRVMVLDWFSTASFAATKSPADTHVTLPESSRGASLSAPASEIFARKAATRAAISSFGNLRNHTIDTLISAQNQKAERTRLANNLSRLILSKRTRTRSEIGTKSVPAEKFSSGRPEILSKIVPRDRENRPARPRRPNATNN
ncbi:hypothetical protein EVAR_26030_1 [Eumeta japonica]|uniref:Uncharacterized protein n=1 Tax=Eumeta variegata TaxID=151549 RepID=A0A4C1VRY8_EUMVA|nr:hypothetical protein EVAR_26030_1 [Eumeta japonica]